MRVPASAGSASTEDGSGDPARPRRLYFALWPDAALRAAIAEVALAEVALAESARSGGRAIPARDWHVTLAFVGPVPAARVDHVRAAGARVVAGGGVQGFDRVECWGRQGALVIAASATVPALARLAEALRNSLDAGGFALTGREFRPHITLAREPAVRAPPRRLPEPLAWAFEDFVLVESHPGRPGRRYEILARFPCRPATPGAAPHS